MLVELEAVKRGGEYVGQEEDLREDSAFVSLLGATITYTSVGW